MRNIDSMPFQKESFIYDKIFRTEIIKGNIYLHLFTYITFIYIFSKDHIIRIHSPTTFPTSLPIQYQLFNFIEKKWLQF